MTGFQKEYVTMGTMLALVIPAITLCLAFTFAVLMNLGDSHDNQALEIRALRERVQVLELQNQKIPFDAYLKRRSSPR